MKFSEKIQHQRLMKIMLIKTPGRKAYLLPEDTFRGKETR